MQKEIEGLKTKNSLAEAALDEKISVRKDSAKFDDLRFDNLNIFSSKKADIKVDDFPDSKALADKIVSGIELENDSRYFYFKEVCLSFEKKLIERVQKMSEQPTDQSKDDFAANVRMLELARVDCFQDDCITKMNIINDAINRFRRLDRF